MTKERFNSASFRQKLDPISKSIIRRQNRLDDILTFDAENPILGLLLSGLDFNKKDLASELIKKAPRL